MPPAASTPARLTTSPTPRQALRTVSIPSSEPASRIRVPHGAPRGVATSCQYAM